MKERNRLDEIVEEESRADSASGWALRIAERAFRHGVEQVRATARPCASWRHYHVPMEWEAVQPGPAEGCKCTVPNEWCDTHSRGTAITMLPFMVDRRKGPRRLRSNVFNGFVNLSRELDGLGWCHVSFRDRRSGMDRRKP